MLRPYYTQQYHQSQLILRFDVEGYDSLLRCSGDYGAEQTRSYPPGYNYATQPRQGQPWPLRPTTDQRSEATNMEQHYGYSTSNSSSASATYEDFIQAEEDDGFEVETSSMSSYITTSHDEDEISPASSPRAFHDLTTVGGYHSAMMPSMSAGSSSASTSSPGGAGALKGKKKKVYKVCVVCKDESERTHLNYGADACLSCRAFFRRAHQKPELPKFTCKRGGYPPCVITVQNRRKCKKCRYDLCIAAGMRPECVLSETQRKRRFRKMRKRKKPTFPTSSPVKSKKSRRRSSVLTITNVLNDNYDDADADTMDADAGQAQGSNAGGDIFESSLELDKIFETLDHVDDDLGVYLSSLAPEHLSEAASASTFSSASRMAASSAAALSTSSSTTFINALGIIREEGGYCPPPTATATATATATSSSGCSCYESASVQVSSKVLELLEDVRRSWHGAVHQLQLDDPFVGGLVTFHRGLPVSTKALFKNHLLNLSRFFRNMALRQAAFSTLPCQDQEKLLLRNTPLFIQFILAKYFTAPTGTEQLQWLLLSKLPKKYFNENLKIRTMPVETFNRVLGIFNSEGTTAIYNNFCHLITAKFSAAAAFEISSSCMPFLATLILFNTSYTFALDEPDAVERHVSDLYRMAASVHELERCSDAELVSASILSVLQTMSGFFAKNALFDEQTSPPLPELLRQIVVIPSSGGGDEVWLSRQLERFETAYRAVAFGEDLLKEFVFFSLDEPLSKHFIPQVVSVFRERLGRVALAAHPDLVSPGDMARLLGANVSCAIALCMVKMECCDTGNAQLRFALGSADETVFARNFAPLMDKSKLKKMTLVDANKSAGKIDSGVMERLMHLATNVESLVRQVDTFRLLVLLALFSPEVVGLKTVERVHSTYVGLLRARLRGDDTAFERLRNGLRDIRALSIIVDDMQAMSLS